MDKTFAYIDGANLHSGNLQLGWELDYARFKIWLKDKYQVEKVYLFLGYISKFDGQYREFEKAGYILVFKEVTYDKYGKVKANCDADLIVLLMQHLYENMFDAAVLVSSDGDYTPLIKLLMTKNKIKCLISPYEPTRCSVLLKRTEVKIVYIAEQRTILENKKAPDRDETL